MAGITGIETVLSSAFSAGRAKPFTAGTGESSGSVSGNDTLTLSREALEAQAEAERHKQLAMEHMKKRIQEVGIAQYAEEQRGVQRVMALLEKMQETYPQLKERIQQFIDYFKDNPPDTAQDMVTYMHGVIRGIKDDDLRKLMGEMLDTLITLYNLEKSASEEAVHAGSATANNPAVHIPA